MGDHLIKSFKLLRAGLVSAFALMAVAPVANAADIYNGDGGLKDAAPIDYAPPITWTGFYLGGHLGALWPDDDDVDFADDAVFIGGGHLGYNWQGASNIVLGVEGDIDFADDLDYLASIRGRLGWAFGPSLIYGTAGVAFIEADEISETGFAAGLGFEHKLRDRVSVGVEGLYYSFDDDNAAEDLEFWTARARLTYHLGGY